MNRPRRIMIVVSRTEQNHKHQATRVCIAKRRKYIRYGWGEPDLNRKRKLEVTDRGRQLGPHLCKTASGTGMTDSRSFKQKLRWFL
jgi:hypothetical protein